MRAVLLLTIFLFVCSLPSEGQNAYLKYIEGDSIHQRNDVIVAISSTGLIGKYQNYSFDKLRSVNLYSRASERIQEVLSSKEIEIIAPALEYSYDSASFYLQKQDTVYLDPR